MNTALGSFREVRFRVSVHSYRLVLCVHRMRISSVHRL